MRLIDTDLDLTFTELESARAALTLLEAQYSADTDLDVLACRDWLFDAVESAKLEPFLKAKELAATFDNELEDLLEV